MKVYIIFSFAVIQSMGCSGEVSVVDNETANLDQLQPLTKSATPPPKLSYLGTVEGKAYFFGTESMVWFHARDACTGAGLQQATITSQEQFNFLWNSTNSEYHHNFYWTGGRESRTKQMFRWDKTNQSLPSFFPDQFENALDREFYICVAYYAAAGEYVEYYRPFAMVECLAHLRVLCETR